MRTPGLPPGGGALLLCSEREPWQLQGSPGSADWGVCVAPSSTRGAGTSCVGSAAASHAGSPCLFLCALAGIRERGASPGSAFLEQPLQRGTWGIAWHSVSGSLWQLDPVAPGDPRAVCVRYQGEFRLCPGLPRVPPGAGGPVSRKTAAPEHPSPAPPGPITGLPSFPVDLLALGGRLGPLVFLRPYTCHLSHPRLIGFPRGHSSQLSHFGPGT